MTLEDLLFADADVKVLPGECTSNAGESVVTEQVPILSFDPMARATLWIDHGERDLPHFPVAIRICREVGGVPVTLRLKLQSVEHCPHDNQCDEWSYKACYWTEGELG